MWVQEDPLIGDRSELTSETVEGTALPLQGVDNVHGGDSLPLGVFSVCDGIPDDILKEDLENTTGLFVDETGDTLDTTTTSQTTDGRLGDTLDVITQHLAMSLGASLSEPLASFATSSHFDAVVTSATYDERMIPEQAERAYLYSRKLLVSTNGYTFRVSRGEKRRPLASSHSELLTVMLLLNAVSRI